MADDLTFGVKISADSAQFVGAAKESAAAMDSLSASTQKAAASQAAMEQASRDYWDTQSKANSAAKDYMARIEEQTAAHKRAAEQIYVVNDSYLKSAEAMGKGTEAIKTNATATREALVLVREASRGNFTRMAGSASILANALGVLPAILSPVGLAIGAVAGAGIGLAIAFEKGRAEMNAMDNALAATSNFAGMTRGQMQMLAASMAESGNVTVGQSKEIVTQLVASGRIGAEAINEVAALTANFAAETGKDISKVGPELAKLFADPLKGAEELNKSMHFLTAAQLDHIGALERTGEAGKAQLELATALKSHLDENSAALSQQGGILESVRKAWSSFWDAAEGVGRPKSSSVEEELANAKDKLTKVQNARMGLGSAPMFGPSEADLLAEVNALQEMADKQKAVASAKSQKVDVDERELKIRDLAKNLKSTRITELEDELKLVEAGKQTNQTLEIEIDLREKIANLQKSPHQKSDPVTASYNSLMKEFNNLALEAQGRTEKLTQAQVKLNEAKASALWNSYSPTQKKTLEESAESARDAESSAKATEINNAAQEESARIIAKVAAADAEAVAQLEFKNSLIGKSTLEVQLLTEANKIKLETDKQMRALDADPKFKGWQGDGQLPPTPVTAAHDDAAQALKKSAQAAQEMTAQQIQSNYDLARSWDTGATESVKAYVDTVTNAAAQSKKLFTDAFKGMEDQLVTFVTTGKVNFTGLVDSILTDLLRIAIQESIMAPLAQAAGLSGMFGSVGNMLGIGVPSPSSIASSGGVQSLPSITQLATGTDYVPQDMLALLHQGEQVVPAAYNPTQGSNATSATTSNTPNFTVNVLNQGSTPLTATQQGGPQFNGSEWVVGVVINAANTNPNFRNAMGIGS